MKNYIYIVVILSFIVSCASTNNIPNKKITSHATSSDTIRIANDSLEYEVIIFEPGFNSWLVTQRPRGYYAEQFLEIRNRQYVTEYNQRVGLPQQFDPNLYLQEINYQRNIRYGYEVNYLLYNYFLFLEQRYRQRFLATRG
ncbi:DUF6146 family protein [Aquimarina pacifica]|uniref:DUF6146 family protein n=1 Tax=Aquimarina pacifica TaxID=1296415 RepID=UPI0004714B5D|nr:DUF6146 family protein [Aquimarina pacifica]